METPKVKCYCGKWLDDPTHKQTHQDKFLTEKEFLRIDLSKVAQVKVRNSVDDPWRFILSKRVGNSFLMIGIYKP
jgi:hypothetical protein